GYDGRGVWRVHDRAGLDALLAQELPSGACWLLEECVPFDQELCAQVARSPSGQAVAYPVVRTRQVDGMCAEVVAPAPQLDESLAMQAQQIALRIAGDLEVVGMLAVEMFQSDGELTVNELAMRPHNSGHWSIEGAITSQFENHLRAVLDLPLGDPGLRSPAAVMVNVIGTDAPDLYSGYRHILARDPQVKVHLYGKSVRPGRKLGQVTLVGTDADVLLVRAQHAAHYLSGIIDE
ncbi:MAG: ATP-grasp domain-containing protein, partial [Actinomycetales bacterium]